MNKINEMSKTELLELNKIICTRIRALDAQENAIKITTFAPGDAVYFVHRGIQVYCVVDRVLRTNVDVTTTQGKKWRVAANLLTKRI